ncbi:Aspargine-linked glycosylation 11 protein [Oopsacas minuta]|uniref:GDP-Man:Man(3)GlcNAc(2)-PP-Dol alpha-1,2-mannosyltransferase n=1 Tax=Oopsacas minuta TaxID=111878 RepID=A0AAV7JC10_9METZ|nr:Aspargine-linked glycosylation 11 protein [Oopsacas minuta]
MLSNHLPAYLLQIICLLIIILKTILIATCVFYWFKVKRYVTRHKSPITSTNPRAIKIAFFHPYCNGGGGGERVLWQTIHAIQIKYPAVVCVVYTCDNINLKDLLDNISRAFYIDLLPNIELVYLNGIRYIEPKTYPRFTILLQNLGSLLLAHEALHKFQPDIFVDTIGYAFTIPYFKVFGRAATCCYVHYPTVSTDMLEKVKSRKDSFNNDTKISTSVILTNLKILYYRTFGYIYGFAGLRSDVTLVNSSWTKGHIDAIWGPRANAEIVYPPCDTSTFSGLHLTRQKPEDRFIICSLGQFRPEKNHACQIRAFNIFLQGLDEVSSGLCELHMIGSCRDHDDIRRVQELKLLSESLGIERRVKFHIKLPFTELLQCLSVCDVAMHTMENEHFGISLVEMMAAGCIMIGHDSGGPKFDIICDYEGDKTGFLAKDEIGFAEKLKEVYLMNLEERMAISSNGRKYVLDKFSIDTFEREIILKTERLFNQSIAS